MGTRLAGIQDYMIHRFIKENGGRVAKEQLLEALAGSEEERRIVEDKLRTMAQYGILVVEGDEVTLP